MINLSSESIISPAQAAGLLPPGRGGRPTHPSTIVRWMRRGFRGRRLESIRLGGRLFTSVQALQRFGDALNPTSCTAQPTPNGTRLAPNEAVDAALDRLGM